MAWAVATNNQENCDEFIEYRIVIEFKYLNMQNNAEKNTKRLTFQGLINAEKEKVPEKSSRSRSRNRSKASSISKSMSNISQLTSRHSLKVEKRVSPQKETVDNSQKSTVIQSVFRENKRTAEQ